MKQVFKSSLSFYFLTLVLITISIASFIFSQARLSAYAGFSARCVPFLNSDCEYNGSIMINYKLVEEVETIRQ